MAALSDYAEKLVLTVTLSNRLNTLLPSTIISSTFRSALLFMSRSALILLGRLPSSDRVLSKAFLRASKLSFRVVVDAYPEEIVVMVGFLAITVI
jgi:hypothetical protein